MRGNKEFLLLESKCEPLTRELAERFRDMKASPTERAMDPKRVKHLRNKVETDLAVTFHWATAMIDGEECRMNGQHSSAMLCEMNGDFPEGLYVHIDRYKVFDEKGLALLFRQFDDRKSSRGPADIAGAYQGLYEELRDLPRGPCKLGIQGIAFYLKHIIGDNVPSGDDVWSMFGSKRYWPFLRWLAALLSSKTNELKRTEVVGAMFATFEANETKAKDFWAWVAKGGDFEPSHPATALDEWLLASRQITDTAKKFKPMEIYQGCITSYNAFCEGRDVSKVRFDTKKNIAEPVR